MNKRFMIICTAFLVIATLLLSCTKKNEYKGHGILFLESYGDDARLVVVNGKGSYYKTLGKKDKCFWLTSHIGDTSSIAVDNNNDIYLMDDDITIYSDIEERITAVLNVGDEHVVFCGSVENNEYYTEVVLYSSDFKNELFRNKIKGSGLQHIFVDGKKVYYAEEDIEKRWCYIRCFDTEEHKDTLIYQDNDCELEVYPFVYNGQVYAVLWDKIIDKSVVNIVTSYTGLEKVMEFDGKMCGVALYNGNIYTSVGVNYEVLNKLNFGEGKIEQIHNADNKSARGVVVMDKKLYFMNSDSIYSLDESGKVELVKKFKNPLNNFYY